MKDGFISQEQASDIYQLLEQNTIPQYKLYHYTTTKVLDIILNNCTFRASNIFYLNDASEYYAGLKALESEFSKKEETNKLQIVKNLMSENAQGKFNAGLYSISFSELEDSLHQWITYAKESGIAIELDCDKILSSQDKLWYGKQEDINENTMNKPNNLKWEPLSVPIKLLLRKVVYGEYNDEMLQNINKTVSDCDEQYMWFASYFKNQGYNAEREVRMVVFPTEYDKYQSKVQYFVMPHGVLRPYINVKFGYIMKDSNKFIPMIPIKSIIIGPSGRQQAVFDSVVHRLVYGENNIDPYIGKGFEERLTEYLQLFDEWIVNKYNNIDEDVREAVKEIIRDKFKIKNPQEKKKEQSNIYYEIFDGFQKDTVLTSEGVIIKKSKIPHIY